MKQRLVSLLLNQYVIALLLAFAVIFFLPDYFSKYKINLVKQDKISANNVVYFQDLNADGISEKVVAMINAYGNASYMIYDSNDNLIDQYNYLSEYLNGFFCLNFSDINRNGYNEIYLISKYQDSVFLNIHEPFVEKGIYKKRLFVDVVNVHNNEYKIRVVKEDAFNPLMQGENEFVFGLSAGFSGSPRNVYKYNLIDDTIIKSPHLTNSFGISELKDIDDDGKNEIIIQSYSSGNSIDSEYTKRSDYDTWLMVLDDDLSFLFQPIKFEALGSIKIITYKKDQKEQLVGFFNSRQYEDSGSKIVSFSVSGSLINEREIPEGYYLKLVKTEDDVFAIYERTTGEIKMFDESLVFGETHSIETHTQLYFANIDNDEGNEWISVYNDDQDVAIYDSALKHKTTFAISDTPNNLVNFGVVNKVNAEKQLFFQAGNYASFFEYKANGLYSLRFLVYIAVYALMLLLVTLIIKGQKLREAKQRAIEQQISELQIKTIKNQVDPHFVFNAINTISEMTLMDNKLEADTFISRFSGFMRDTLQHSDKISTTLKEELDYTENFIKLQQVRFYNQFDYTISVHKNVIVNSLVPKHVLFTYVENTIKHGLASKDKGHLQITAKQTKDDLVLTVQDNGSGIVGTKQQKANSTGNGLLIMKRIFSLYTQLTKRKITYSVVNLKDKDADSSGVKVEIRIEKLKIRTKK